MSLVKAEEKKPILLCKGEEIKVGDTEETLVAYCDSPDELDTQYEFRKWKVITDPPRTHITVTENLVWIFYAMDDMELRREVTLVTIDGHRGIITDIRVIK